MTNEQKNPWKTLSSVERFDNPWISVVENDCLNPAGNPAKYSVVHFKNIAVGVLPIDDQGYTYLVGQYRYPLNRYEWEIPMGGCPKTEDPLQAAQRELLEETGLVANSYQQLLELAVSDCVTDEIAYSYLATGLTQQQACPEDCEQLAIRKLKFTEVFNLVMNGEIRDAVSVATILKYKQLKGA